MTNALILDITKGVATLTLNRPEAYNTLDVAMLDALPPLLAELSENPAVRCVVITGWGEKAFCAGGDISGLTGSEETAETKELSERLVAWGQASRLLHEMPKPTLAVVNGAAAGAGMALALACDLRLATSSAHFTPAFSRLAMSGDFGGSYFLTQLVGPSKARELYFFSPRITAEDALDLGLVNWMVNAEELAGKLEEVVSHLVAMPPLTAKYIKQNMNNALVENAAEIIRQESYNMIETALSEETQQAAMAFFAIRNK